MEVKYTLVRREKIYNVEAENGGKRYVGKERKNI